MTLALIVSFCFTAMPRSDCIFLLIHFFVGNFMSSIGFGLQPLDPVRTLSALGSHSSTLAMGCCSCLDRQWKTDGARASSHSLVDEACCLQFSLLIAQSMSFDHCSIDHL